jgi:hypothetical protein
VNGKIAAWAVLCDQWTDETLVTAVNGTIAEVADHAHRCWRRPRKVKDRGIPTLAEEDRHRIGLGYSG